MIHLQNIDFFYKKKAPLFTNLNLELESGKIYGLLGKNASGKSTLFKLMVGALFPKSGMMAIDGYNMINRHPDILAQIYYLQEQFNTPDLSIRKYGEIYGDFYPHFDKANYKRIIGIFEMDLSQSLRSLSYGQNKKAMIAFGLASGCKYLLLDEPTNGLDIPSKGKLRTLIASEIEDHQTVIISTHQVRDIASSLESVIIIDSGKVLLSQDLFEISNKLYFTHSTNESVTGDVFYSELAGGGYIHIMKNENNEPSDVEIEALFNAITKHPTLIKKYF